MKDQLAVACHAIAKERLHESAEMTAEEAANKLEAQAQCCRDVDDMEDEEPLSYAASILRRVASGELAEVIHAHWIQGTRKVIDGYDYGYEPTYTCSHCHHEEEYRKTPCCPNCGALMDGKDDSHE